MLVQQVREEDMARVRAVYDRLKIDAELAPFFTDLPARLASSHLIISRSGAGTVAELGAVGRPSILVPLPGSIDQDQFANAGVLAQAGGAIRIAQADFTPDRLAAEISALAAEPARLTAMAAGARTVGKLDAAERLADLVAKVAGIIERHDRVLFLLQCAHHLLIEFQMGLQQLGRRQRQPLVQRQVRIIAALEHLQEAQRRVAGVLDIMAHRVRDIADVAGLVIEGARLPRGCEHAHAALAFDVVLPFVGVGMPVQFAHSAGRDFDQCSGNRLRGAESCSSW